MVLQVVELFIGKYDYAWEMCFGFLRRRAKDYANAIQDANATLDKFVGVFDSTKIRLRKPSGNNSYHQAVDLGHKHVHFFIYHSITTLDGLVFNFYSHTEKRLDSLTLFCKIGWSDVWHDRLYIDDERY